MVVAGVQEGVWPDLRLRGSLLGSEHLVDVVTGRGGRRSGRLRPRCATTRPGRSSWRSPGRSERLVVTAVRSDDEQPSVYLDVVDPETIATQGDRPFAEVARTMTLPTLVGELRRQLVVRRRRGAARRPWRPWPGWPARACPAPTRPSGGRCASVSDDRPAARARPGGAGLAEQGRPLRQLRPAVAAAARRRRRPVDRRRGHRHAGARDRRTTSATPTPTRSPPSSTPAGDASGCRAGWVSRPQAPRGARHGPAARDLLRRGPGRGVGPARRRGAHAGSPSVARWSAARSTGSRARPTARPAGGRLQDRQQQAARRGAAPAPAARRLPAGRRAGRLRRARRPRRPGRRCSSSASAAAGQDAPCRPRARSSATTRSRSGPPTWSTSTPRAWPAPTFQATVGDCVQPARCGPRCPAQPEGRVL